MISVGCSAAHSNIISNSLVTPAKNCLRLLRPLLEILLSASELLRTTEPFHIDETRSVFPNLSCREIVDCSHYIGKFRSCCHLSSQSEQLLLKLRHDLLHRHRHRYWSEFRKFVQQAIAATQQVNTFRRIPGDSSCHVKLSTTAAPLAFHRPHARSSTTIQQTKSTRERDTTAERPPPAVHQTKQRIEQRPLRSPGALRDVSRHVTSHHATMMKQYDCVSYAVNRFLEPFMRSVRINDGRIRYCT